MQFAIGYQLYEGGGGEEPFVALVRDFLPYIAEVYFPWGDMPSGRSPLVSRRGYTDWSAQRRLEEDLHALRAMGVRLDVLFNANCYGEKAVSRHLEQQTASVLEHLHELVGGVDAVTTTSLTVARTVQRYFPQVEVRASVNMRIGTIKGMQYVAGLFDSFYLQREYNRDLAYIDEVKAWTDAQGKGLYLLANSGCLSFCSGQTFHDNLVAHEAEVAETTPIAAWNPLVCWHYFRERTHWPAVLQNSWIRPEDLHHYEDRFPVVKLATRMHAHPRLVLQAYASRRYHGNLLDLFEPGFSPVFAPYILDNDHFPPEWFTRTSTCDRRCHRCDYCATVLDRVAVSQGDA